VKYKFTFWPLLLLLAGCAYNDNSHLRSAVPPSAGQLVIGLGCTNVALLYPLHIFEPAEVDSSIHNMKINTFSWHAPLSYDVGLGKGFSLGTDMGVALSSSFEGPGYDEYFSEIGFNPFIKVNTLKSIDIGHGFYAALNPAVSTGRGVDFVRRGWRSRFEYSSVELPLTLSKIIDFPPVSRFVISLTARSAKDWLACDLNGPGVGSWTYITYPGQPLLKATRYAIMGAIEYRFQGNTFMAIQWGREKASANSKSQWAPIFALRIGVILPTL